MTKQISIKAFLVWGICALFFTYEFMLRTVIGTFQHPITYDLQLNAVRFALLSATAYQLIYGLMQIPVGVITDKLGLKKTLIVASFLCAGASAGLAFTNHFYSAILFRMLMGFGSAFGFICLLIAVYEWMPRKNIGLFIGLSQFIGTMGPMLAAGPVGALADAGTVTWRSFFYILSLVGMGLAVAVFFLVENNRESTGRFLILNPSKGHFSDIKRLLSQKQTWFIGLFSALVYFSIEYLSENEGKLFLGVNGYSETFSSYMLTLAWLGYAIGCPLFGFISDKMQRRKPLLIFSACTCLISMIGIVFFPINKLYLIIYFTFLGLGASGQSLGFAVMAEQCKESYVTLGLAFNNFFIISIAASNAPMLGWLLTHFSQGSATEHFSLTTYHQAFSFIIGLLVLAVILSIFAIKETFCKSVRENLILSTQSEEN